METILNWLQENVATISGYILGIGIVWTVISKVGNLAKEVGELLMVFAEAIADKKISNDEIAKIVKEAKDIPAAIKDLKNIKWTQK